MGKKNDNTLVKNASFLMVAALISKIIGMLYKSPLSTTLGSQSFALFQFAQNVYFILLMIASFSIPQAVSKIMAEKIAFHRYKDAQKVFYGALIYAAVAGGIVAFVCVFGARILVPDSMANARLALQMLAPTIFMSGLCGVFRGYFQAYRNMMPTSISQIIEQIINAIVSVAGAYVMLQYGLKLGEKKGDAELGTALAAAGGTFGTVASVGVALLFMIVIYLGYRNGFKRRMKKDKTRRRESDRAIYRAITYTILPIVLSTLVYNISTIIDQGVFNHILAGMGFTQKQYATVWGIYSGKFRVLMNVPLSIASCLAPSVVPALTEAMANNDLREAGLRTRDTIRYTMVFTIPCAVGMAALARPIMMMLYGNNDSLALAAGIMQSGALLTVLLALSTLTTGILQGLGEMQAPLVHAATAVAIHLGFLVLFVVKFKWNIYGVVYANIIFGLIICLLNARSIRKKLHYRQEIKKTFLVPVIAAGVMGIAAYLVHRVFNLFAGNTISTILAVCVGAVVYGICLVKLGGILEREIRRLPKGDLLADLLIRLNIL